jgi:hypothetical protein
MATHQVNGEVPNAVHSSAFIQHLLDYPFISDGIKSFKSHEYGQRSIALTDSAYKTFAAPVIPFFLKPYQYVSPYVSKADSFGDATLTSLDERFPAVKKPTADIYADTKGLIYLPLNKGLEGRDHVFQVYSSEIKKVEQQGIVAHSKAALLTALVVSNETLSWFSSFIAKKKGEASQVVHEKVNQ